VEEASGHGHFDNKLRALLWIPVAALSSLETEN
jgi:hypothetical protein